MRRKVDEAVLCLHQPYHCTNHDCRSHDTRSLITSVVLGFTRLCCVSRSRCSAQGCVCAISVWPEFTAKTGWDVQEGVVDAKPRSCGGRQEMGDGRWTTQQQTQQTEQSRAEQVAPLHARCTVPSLCVGCFRWWLLPFRLYCCSTFHGNLLNLYDLIPGTSPGVVCCCTCRLANYTTRNSESGQGGSSTAVDPIAYGVAVRCSGVRASDVRHGV